MAERPAPDFIRAGVVREAFLSCFSTRMRSRVLDFSRELQDVSADVFILMARKSACFVDCLTRLHLTSLDGIVTTDRVLDNDSTWLQGRHVALVDDALITGTTLATTRSRIIEAGAEVVATKVLCVNRDWWAPNLVIPDDPVVSLTDADTGQVCNSIVAALSLFPRPYATDYPLYRGLRIPNSQLTDALRLPQWSSRDLTTPLQDRHDVLNITIEPSRSLLERIGNDVNLSLTDLVTIAKLRLYGRLVRTTRRRPIVFFQVMPIVAFNPIGAEHLQSLLEDAIPSSTLEHVRLRRSCNASAVAGLRLLSYLAASRLANHWYSDLSRHLTSSVQLTHDPSSALALFPPDVADTLVHLCDHYESPSRSMKQVQGRECPIDDEVPVPSLDTPSLWHAQARLLAPFRWMYFDRELPARKRARALTEEERLRPESVFELDRLARGLSLPELLSRTGDLGDGSPRSEALSRFLDYSIDRGFVVPITRQSDDIVYRAYRHGEDIREAEQLHRLALEALQSFEVHSGRDAIPGTWAQKLLVALLKLLTAKGQLETSDGIIGGTRSVGIRSDLHGPVLKVGVDKLYAPQDPRFYTRLLVDLRYLRRDGKGYHVSSEPIGLPAPPADALNTARALGTIVGVLSGRREGAPHLELGAFTLLCGCSTARDAMAVLAAELCLMNVHWHQQRRALVHPVGTDRDKRHMASRFRNSTLFTAINNGRWKYNAFRSGEPMRIMTALSSGFATHQAKRDSPEHKHIVELWQLTWDSVRTAWDLERPGDASKALRQLVDAEGALLICANILFRILEAISWSTPTPFQRNTQQDLNDLLSELPTADVGNGTVPAVQRLAQKMLERDAAITGGAFRRRVLSLIDQVASVGAALLDEVDIYASTSGRPRPVEHYRHALSVLLLGEQAGAIAATEVAEMLSQLQLLTRRESGGQLSVRIHELAGDSDSTQWLVLSRGPMARRALLELSFKLHRQCASRYVVQLTMLSDLDHHESAIHGGLDSTLHGESFKARLGEVSRIVTKRGHALTVVTPPHRGVPQAISKEVRDVSEGTMVSQAPPLSCVLQEPYTRTFIMLDFGPHREIQTRLPEKADVAVVTVLPREASGLRDVLSSMPQYVRRDEGRVFESARIPSCDEDQYHTLVATTSIAQGQAEIVPACTDLIDRFDPFLLVLLGVAGSIDSEVRLLDVVCANQVISYMKTKETPEGVVVRGEGYQVPAPVLKAMNEVETLHGGCPFPLVGSDGLEFHVHSRPIGTGTAVIGVRDSETIQWLKHFNDKSGAIETEAHGVSQAFLQLSLRSQPRRAKGVVIIRGISDHADEEKNDAHQVAAGRNAGLALIELLRAIPLLGQRQLIG